MMPRTGTYRVKVPFAVDDRRLEIALFGEADPHFVIERSGAGAVSVRTVRHGLEGATEFAHRYPVDLPADASGDIDIFVDNGIVEFCAGGAVWITNLYFPADPAGEVRLTAIADGKVPIIANVES
jgi:hypothetical protein